MRPSRARPSGGTAVVEALRKDGVLGEETLIERCMGNPFTVKTERVRDDRVWRPGPHALDATTADVVGTQGADVLVRQDGVVEPYFDFRRRNPCHVEVKIDWMRRGAVDVRSLERRRARAPVLELVVAAPVGIERVNAATGSLLVVAPHYRL